jgi:hypothetical protein
MAGSEQVAGACQNKATPPSVLPLAAQGTLLEENGDAVKDTC